ncbi:hypothetical protein BV898_02056, partial [Hypsibius exemplaris]
SHAFTTGDHVGTLLSVLRVPCCAPLHDDFHCPAAGLDDSQSPPRTLPRLRLLLIVFVFRFPTTPPHFFHHHRDYVDLFRSGTRDFRGGTRHGACFGRYCDFRQRGGTGTSACDFVNEEQARRSVTRLVRQHGAVGRRDSSTRNKHGAVRGGTREWSPRRTRHRACPGGTPTSSNEEEQGTVLFPVFGGRGDRFDRPRLHRHPTGGVQAHQHMDPAMGGMRKSTTIMETRQGPLPVSDRDGVCWVSN